MPLRLLHSHTRQWGRGRRTTSRSSSRRPGRWYRRSCRCALSRCRRQRALGVNKHNARKQPLHAQKKRVRRRLSRQQRLLHQHVQRPAAGQRQPAHFIVDKLFLPHQMSAPVLHGAWRCPGFPLVVRRNDQNKNVLDEHPATPPELRQAILLPASSMPRSGIRRRPCVAGTIYDLPIAQTPIHGAFFASPDCLSLTPDAVQWLYTVALATLPPDMDPKNSVTQLCALTRMCQLPALCDLFVEETTDFVMPTLVTRGDDCDGVAIAASTLARWLHENKALLPKPLQKLRWAPAVMTMFLNRDPNTGARNGGHIMFGITALTRSGAPERFYLGDSVAPCFPVPTDGSAAVPIKPQCYNRACRSISPMGPDLLWPDVGGGLDWLLTWADQPRAYDLGDVPVEHMHALRAGDAKPKAVPLCSDYVQAVAACDRAWKEVWMPSLSFDKHPGANERVLASVRLRARTDALCARNAPTDTAWAEIPLLVEHSGKTRHDKWVLELVE
jgi:hypothetical protein